MGECCHGLMAGTACAVVPLATVLLCLLVVMSPRCAGEHGAAAVGGQLEPCLGRGGGGAAVEPLAPRLSGCRRRALGRLGEGGGGGGLWCCVPPSCLRAASRCVGNGLRDPVNLLRRRLGA